MSHSPLAITYISRSMPETEAKKKKLNTTLLLRQTKSMLQDTLFPNIDFEDTLIDDGLPVIRKINKSMKNIRNIQDACTILRNNVMSTDRNHPWARGKKYKSIRNVRNAAQRKHNETWLNVDKHALKLANIALKAESLRLKTIHFDKLIQNSSGKSRELFTIMKEKRKPVQKLPIRMTHQGHSLYGAARAEKLAEFLESCFFPSLMQFSQNFDEFDEQIGDIYRQSYSNEHTNLWNDYSNEFRIQDVQRAINELSVKKDCGPMGIPTIMIKYNAEVIAPILKNIFDVILSSGRMPADWKESYLIPIPKRAIPWKFPITAGSPSNQLFRRYSINCSLRKSCIISNQ